MNESFKQRKKWPWCSCYGYFVEATHMLKTTGSYALVGLTNSSLVIQAPIFGIFLVVLSLNHAIASHPLNSESKALPTTMGEWVAQANPGQNRLPESGVPTEPI